MKRFQQGILLGLSLSVLIALALALTFNEERRRQLNHFLERLKPFVREAEVEAQKTSGDEHEQAQASTV